MKAMKYSTINAQLKNSITIIMGLILVLMGQPSFADTDKWKVRLRGIGIIPLDDSTTVLAGNTTSQGSGVTIDESFVPELDITYMVTPHIGIEAIAGMANHTVSIDGTSTATLAALGANDGFEIFDTWVLPPTVTLQWHFFPESNIRPYIGAGVNYTATFGDNATAELESAVGGPVKVSTENSWGLAAQFGLDYDINGNWYFNIDVKYIDIDTHAKLGVNGGANAGTVLNVDLDVDPIVIGAGIGFSF